MLVWFCDNLWSYELNLRSPVLFAYLVFWVFCSTFGLVFGPALGADTDSHCRF